ncbi:MAG: hypothetical protein MJZ87_02850 [Bacteroidales bacterium]|nr:hypothetical protein [Bacteroidales bacterium]
MKKQITLWMAVIMLFGTITMFAQKPFAGTITFETTAPNSTDPNLAAQLAESTETVMLLGNSTRTDANQMGVGITVITNGDYKNVTTVIDIPGYGKYFIEVEGEKLQKAFETMKIDYDYTQETKSICGYDCKKVNAKITNLETDEEETVVYWVTDGLMTGDNINFLTAPGLKGYALCTEQNQEVSGEDILFVKTATAVTPSKKVKAGNFLRPSDATNIKDASKEVKDMLGYEDEE